MKTEPIWVIHDTGRRCMGIASYTRDLDAWAESRGATLNHETTSDDFVNIFLDGEYLGQHRYTAERVLCSD